MFGCCYLLEGLRLAGHVKQFQLATNQIAFAIIAQAKRMAYQHVEAGNQAMLLLVSRITPGESHPGCNGFRKAGSASIQGVVERECSISSVAPDHSEGLPKAKI